jgi:outer membrane receptor protein involved in Fe transport
MRRILSTVLVALFISLFHIAAAAAQDAATLPASGTGTVTGAVTDESGGVLPGVTVELRTRAGMTVSETITDEKGVYAFNNVTPGGYQLRYTLINFASKVHPDLEIAAGAVARNNETLQLSLNAEVVVIGRRTFTNLADVENPAENLVGIASSASQGAITSRQLEVRPFMRQGEVLETVPGVIITQHSGEGKANQYFLRGFNLDHGTDFASTVAGVPVNMPTHAHSHGYSDINFLIPELVAGVQYSKGPYFADQGDFATAGASNINYATVLDRPTVHVQFGSFDYARLFAAASPRIGRGNLLLAGETSNNSGPWTVPDDYRKWNGVARYTIGDNLNGVSFTAMGYKAKWNATEATPQRAIDAGFPRFGSIDPTDGGHSYRYSLSGDWQRSSGQTLTKVTAFGMGYDLSLISNFTFYLDDPVHGDQREQIDHRFVSGAKAFQRRLTRIGDRVMQNTYGLNFRNDDVMRVALIHTEERQPLAALGDASAIVTSLGGFYQNEMEWTPWLRTTAGIRVDGQRFDVTDKLISANTGTDSAAIVSPKGTVTFGPWNGSEFYVNAGTGFHSNSALGVTLKQDSNGNPVDPVTPLVRAKGAELGFRTVRIPHLQSTTSLWMLKLGSELVYNGDVGATEPGPGSNRYGVEFANYYSPKPWLVFDGDLSWSHARFATGEYVPEAVGVVVSGGGSVDNFHRAFASLRVRYFGPRTLTEDNLVRSDSTTLLNVETGYALVKRVRVNLDVFNLLDAKVSDIDYFFASRLPGEPLGGVEGIHTHPSVPRTARVSFVVGF